MWKKIIEDKYDAVKSEKIDENVSRQTGQPLNLNTETSRRVLLQNKFWKRSTPYKGKELYISNTLNQFDQTDLILCVLAKPM